MAKVQLTAPEVARLKKPIRGKGGFQVLLRKLAGKVGADSAVDLEADDVEKLLRYSFKYGPGGFQDRAKPTARRAAKKR